MGYRDEPPKALIFDWDDTICPSSFVDRCQVEQFDQLPVDVSQTTILSQYMMAMDRTKVLLTNLVHVFDSFLCGNSSDPLVSRFVPFSLLGIRYKDFSMKSVELQKSACSKHQNTAR